MDLVAEVAQYHRPCYARFCLPTRSSGATLGRPEDAEIADGMARVYKYLQENEDKCQFSLRELSSLLDNPPSDATLKRKLIEHYGDDLVITSLVGRTPIVSFRTHHVLLDSWYKNKYSNEAEERMRIVEAAYGIIAEDIQSQIYDTDYYPDPDNFLETSEENVPPTLRLFLRGLISKNKRGPKDKYDTKCISIAHAIIAAARPRSFSSCVQLSLGAVIHSTVGSRRLIDILAAMGYCASYNEVQNFQLSAIMHPESPIDKGFVQFVADNADVNIDTLDGLNTFHSMGMIECVTPKRNGVNSGRIFRITDVPSAVVLGRLGNVPIETYSAETATDEYEKLEVMQLENTPKITLRTSDIIWMYGKVHDIPRICGWNGFMEQFTASNKYAMTEVIPLPFINAPPSDLNTIYTTLLNALEKCDTLKQQSCIVTFDQPLYQKARRMVACSPDPRFRRIIVRLGGFHMMMSFMGSIGYIMSGSGLKDVLSQIYAPLSVDKMLTGHAYARAVRGHFLAALALGHLVFDRIDFTDDEKSEIEDVLDNFDDGKSRDKLRDEPFLSLSLRFHEELDKMEKNGPTSALWVMYFRLVGVTKQFIEAERTGNWKLHLSTVTSMLPIFHATGHFNYALSGQLYLQDMLQLQSMMPASEFRNFVTNSFFTIRRAHKFWSGIWSDMTIEQTLMRLMKSKGGLTSGRGMTDSTITRWTLGMPTMNRVSQALEDFIGVSSATTEQHIDARPTRQDRDNKDVHKLVQWFQNHDPFPILDSIVSLGTGVIGGDDINCYKAYDIGVERVEYIIGKRFSDISFSRKKRVLPLSAVSSSVKIYDAVVPIDPTLLYQRISFMKQSAEDLKKYLSYELSPFPLSLFDEIGMRKSKKSALYDLFQPVSHIESSGKVLFVIDGGFLVHKVVWNKDEMFLFICEKYVKYLQNHFKGDITIVFDGYSDDVSQRSTKSAERLRRSLKAVAAETFFDESMKVATTQSKFLSNEKNKSRLITMLMKKFQTVGFTAKQDNEDADKLIVSTALERSQDYDSVFIVGEDTDLLAILTGTSQEEHSNVYFVKPGTRQKNTTCYYSTKSLKNPALAKHILFCHAFTGCDTTSALFNIGKLKLPSLFLKNISLRDHAEKFYDPEADPDSIADAGEQVMISLYKGRNVNTLDNLRAIAFGQSISKSKFNLASMPPTTAAARQHSFRVYHQVQHWLGNGKLAESWGWKMESRGLIPVSTLKEAAPPELLQFVACKCEKGCSSGRCSCRKSGLKCSEACYFCHGLSCENAKEIDHAEIDDGDDESGLEMERWLSQSNKTGQPLDSNLDDDEEEEEALHDDEEDADSNELENMESEIAGRNEETSSDTERSFSGSPDRKRRRHI